MLTAEERAHLEAIRADFAKHEEGSAADTEFLLALVDRLAADSERIDGLERAIRYGGEHHDNSWVVLNAWYSKPGGPDGFSANYGESHADAVEWPTLREAIDEMLKDIPR